MNLDFSTVLSFSQELQDSINFAFHPPEEGYKSQTQLVLPFVIVKDTRGYIEKITNQINGCYEKGWFDACAVMMRRLLETAIIEVYESLNIAEKIRNSGGDYFYLSDLIGVILNESEFALGRNTKSSLRKLKKIGDMSAHSRRYNANYSDIEKIQNDFRIAIQELIYLADLN